MEESKDGRRWWPVVGSTAATVLGCLMIAALPRFVGASWPAIGTCLGAVPLPVIGALVVLWFLGLLVHVPVLTAALPGLGVRQALILNLSGSAVSNVLPVGGPAGMGLGYAMTRSWGFRPEAFASFTVATNLWNAVGKFVAGLGVLALAAVLGVPLPSGLAPVILGASAFVLVAGGAAAATFRCESAAAGVGRRLDALLARVRPGSDPLVCTGWLLSSRRELVVVVRDGWRRMTVGVLLYLGLQAALLLACLAAVGAEVPVGYVLIAFAIERLISLAPITPGASGVAELGTVAALHFFGMDPVVAAAGVLLYRTLMFAIEIPIGGTIALGWLRRHRRGAGHIEAPVIAHVELVTTGAAS
ncbi:MAG TPA: lysylphosphatidylglycerol synthase domain-containing protein [Marmoricola sp.]|jgi:uncharacterized membrane protein YbhN (UPF0104 family)|nr:lysylphosphatidylglycerol synthase domain-containing protein [Marmoricola sp.]